MNIVSNSNSIWGYLIVNNNKLKYKNNHNKHAIIFKNSRTFLKIIILIHHYIPILTCNFINLLFLIINYSFISYYTIILNIEIDIIF